VGSLYTPSLAAICVATKPLVTEAFDAIGRKLAHALYYREMGRIMTSQHRFFTMTYQIQRAGSENVTEFLKGLLPDRTIGDKYNVKNYSTRFAYLSGCKHDEDFFVFASQFGYGLVCWGVVLGPALEVDESNGVLKMANWQNGATPFVPLALARR
jgi:hypothetical protein